MSAAYTLEEISKMIDHSLLNPSLTVEELEAGCQIALRYNIASVCIMPYYLAALQRALARQHRPGQHHHRLPARRPPHRIKVAEAEQALADGGHGARHGGQHQQGAERRLGLRCR